MNNFQEQPDLTREKNHLLERAVRKIAQTIQQEEFKITPLVDDRLKTALNELNAAEIQTTAEAILILAIEQLAEIEGGFPGNLENIYLEHLAKQLAKEVSDDNPIYQILRTKAGELKCHKINLDSKKLQELIEHFIKRP